MYTALCGWTADTVLIKEVSLIRSVLNSEVPLYFVLHTAEYDKELMDKRFIISELLFNCAISLDFVQDEYPIRLVDDSGSANSGLLQVLYNGTWGTVCDHFFGTNEANVVCRQLGFSEGGQLARRGEFRPTDSAPIWLDEVQCHGNEGHLEECDFPGWGRHEHCTHFEDVGLHCTGEEEGMLCICTCV